MKVDWLYQGQPLDTPPANALSFVYQITNLVSGKAYIGFKLFYFTKTKILKGKRKKILEESDWRTYWSSSDELRADVLQHGMENFQREILYICPNKAIGKYLEAQVQMDRRVLENPDKFYNGIINLRVSRNHIKQLLDPPNQRLNATS